MRNATETIKSGLLSPVRRITMAADVFAADGTKKYEIRKDTNLVSLSLEKAGEESKFFGFGICQKMNLKAIDKERAMSIQTSDKIRITQGIEGSSLVNAVVFYPTETHRDETTNQVSITAYDRLYKATEHTYAELDMPTAYTIADLANACCNLLGIEAGYKTINVTDTVFDTLYPTGGNFEGNETIREVLNAVAEATQTIFYLDEGQENLLVFRRLDKDGAAVFGIDKSLYFSLTTGDNKRLGAIASVTELGDNVATIEQTGSTQYIRNNPLLDLREDVAAMLDAAIAINGGLTIGQFECNWRGNFLLEIGDKIALTAKDGSIIYSYLLDETLTYNGSLSAKSRWKYSSTETESSNPTTLQDALNQTYARVDKANKEIEIIASKTESNEGNIAALQMNTNSIAASVTNVEHSTLSALDSLNGEVETLTNKVNSTMSADQVKLEIATEMAKGVDKVTTQTGFTFDNAGLTVSKTGMEMKTQITEDGMQVFKGNSAVLTANNVGVEAINLHAKTYMIIGTNSRIEDYGYNRTGVFWIGG